MLKRKIENQLIEWKNQSNHKPLVIKGIRQCGKTFIVKKFAEDHYKHVVYLNFVQKPELSIPFEGSLEVDDIIMGITAMVKGAIFEPGKTCLILDEIQA